MDVLGAMIRYGVSLSRLLELTAQWDQILALGPMYLVTLDDLSFGRDLGIGAFCDAAAGVHRRLCDFIHQVVVLRRAWVPYSVFSAGGGRGSVEAWYISACPPFCC